ncbi:MAG: protein kinase [Planctomycetota bacterium]
MATLKKTDPFIGKKLGHVVVKEFLGSGAMGVVYKGVHEYLGTTVAVKFMTQAISHNEEYVGRFMREARLMASIDHQNIVRVLDAGEIEGLHYMVMELMRAQVMVAAGIKPIRRPIRRPEVVRRRTSPSTRLRALSASRMGRARSPKQAMPRVDRIADAGRQSPAPFDTTQGPERQSTTLSEVERSNGPSQPTEARRGFRMGSKARVAFLRAGI